MAAQRSVKAVVQKVSCLFRLGIYTYIHYLPISLLATLRYQRYSKVYSGSNQF